MEATPRKRRTAGRGSCRWSAAHAQAAGARHHVAQLADFRMDANTHLSGLLPISGAVAPFDRYVNGDAGEDEQETQEHRLGAGAIDRPQRIKEAEYA